MGAGRTRLGRGSQSVVDGVEGGVAPAAAPATCDAGRAVPERDGPGGDETSAAFHER